MTLIYRRACCVGFTPTVLNGPVPSSREENYASSQGRNWFFAGPSSIVCDREAKCSTYECPDGYHTRTMAEFLVCAGSRCNTRDDRDTCCYELEEESESAELYSKSARDDKTKPGRTRIKSA